MPARRSVGRLRLHIGERQEANLQRRTDCFAPIGCTQLAEDVVKMRLDRRSRQAEIPRHSLGRVPLRDTAKDWLTFWK